MRASDYFEIRNDPIIIRERIHLIGTGQSFSGEGIVIMAKDAHTLKSFLDERLDHPKFNPDLFKRMIVAEESKATKAGE